jgi:hypothetical protein
MAEVTLVYSELDVSRPVHVLIVGVGWYGQRNKEGQPSQDGGLPELPGLAKSVRRAVSTWRGAGPRLIDTTLSTIDVLFSGKTDSLDIKGIEGEDVEPATLANVRRTFEAWVARGRSNVNSLAILHWLGHGAAESEAERVIEALALYCEDLSPTGEQTAISLSRSIRSLRHIEFSRDCLCFIDVCRSKEPDFTGFSGAWPYGEQRHRHPNNVLCFGLKHYGSKTICRPEPSPEVGFQGGNVITEATLDAFERFGGTPATSIRNARIAPFDLEPAIQTRLDWWRRAFNIPEFTDVTTGIGGDGSFYFVTIPHRGCMVEIQTPLGCSPPPIAHLLQRGTDDEVKAQRKPLHKLKQSHLAEVDGGAWWAVKGDVNCSPYPPESARKPVEAFPIYRRESWS